MRIFGFYFNCHVKTTVYISLMSKSNEQLFYAVGVGRRVGVYNTWNECKSQVDGIKNPKFRKFYSLQEAEEFVKYWNDKFSSPNKSVYDEKSTDPGACSANRRREDRKSLKAEGIHPVALKFSEEKSSENNESIHIENIQEKISYCEKKIDLYMNQLSTVLSGLKNIKKEFGQLSELCKDFSGKKVRNLCKTSFSKPGSLNGKSTSPNSENGELFEHRPEKINDDISHGMTVEDFDFSELDESESPLKRRRISSEEDTEESECRKLKKKVSRTKCEKDSVSFITDKDDYVAVYTDGCCLANGYSNAKAGIGIWFGEDHPLNVSEPFRGVLPTNNNAEIQAARMAVEIALKSNISKLKIITDSQFLINSVTKWIPKWKRNNWIASNNKHVENRVELEKLDKVLSLLSVRWVCFFLSLYHGKKFPDIAGYEGMKKQIGWQIKELPYT